MTGTANWSDLGTLDPVEKNLAGTRHALKTIAALDCIGDALSSVDQLDDAVSDIAADVEIGIHERGAWKG